MSDLSNRVGDPSTLPYPTSKLGAHALPDPQRKWEVLKALKDGNLSINAALAACGASWNSWHDWQHEDSADAAAWREDVARARVTVAAWHADRSLEVTREGRAEIALLGEKQAKVASALASLYREEAVGHRWRATVQDPSNYADKSKGDAGLGSVTVVVALPPLAPLPQATARVAGNEKAPQLLEGPDVVVGEG